VLAINNVTTQRGERSEVIKLTPSALPSAPAKIEIKAETNYAATWLLLEWPEPLDTGAGNPMAAGAVKVPISLYQLEVDEGFGAGWVAITSSG
jgi:hypothetical protein